MLVTATEFKTHFGEYLAALKKEDLFITKNGKTIAKVVNPNVSAVDSLSGLLEGKIPDDFDADQLKEGRLERYALND